MSEYTPTVAAEHSPPFAAEQFLPLVYNELRRLAARKLAHEKNGQTLQPTALVHEAYMRLLETRDHSKFEEKRWDSPAHFFAAAAEAMRRILIDRARMKRSAKRGNGRKRLNIDAIDLATQAAPERLLAIDDAVTRLSRKDPAAARLVELRYFAGLTVDEAGKTLGMSTATAYRHWKYARAWLYTELRESADW
jgi:RNA polymerase sigma factor (TIGR02999 family)